MFFEVGFEFDVDVCFELVYEGIFVFGIVDGEYVGVCGRCLIDIVWFVEVEF